MFSNFFGKPDPKETQRQADRELRKVSREIDRERNKLENEEKKLEMEIKKAANAGNAAGAKMLAKQLIQLRKQKNRTFTAKSQIQNIGFQNKAMSTNLKLTDAMGTASKTMADINKISNPAKLAQDLGQFSKESMKMEMTEEMINDTFDDMLSDDEEESSGIINQVLDEIGIEISGKVRNAPLAPKENLGDKEIEAQLAKLKLPE